MNKIIKLYHIIEKYYIILLGLVMLSLYIYLRFIRERLPRDIPFTLSILGFFILVELCCIYAYMVYRLIKPAKQPHEVIKIIVDVILKPLEELDNTIINTTLINSYYIKFMFWFIYKSEYIFKTIIFDLIFFVFPYFILLATFIIDIFVYNKLVYIYKVLFVGILILLRRYVLYSFKKFKHNLMAQFTLYIEYIITKYVPGVDPSEWPENFNPEEEDDDDEIPPTMALLPQIFIDFYAKSKIYNNIERNFSFWRTNNFYELCKADKGFIQSSMEAKALYDQQEIKLNTLFKHLLQLNVILEYYTNINLKNKVLIVSRIVIYSIYLALWLYILCISIHTLNIYELLIVMNLTWLEIQEPFSVTLMLDYNE